MPNVVRPLHGLSTAVHGLVLLHNFGRFLTMFGMTTLIIFCWNIVPWCRSFQTIHNAVGETLGERKDNFMYL